MNLQVGRPRSATRALAVLALATALAAPIGARGASGGCKIAGTFSWASIAPHSYSVHAHFRGNNCGNVAGAPFTLDMSGVTSTVGRCSSPAGPLTQTIRVDLSGGILVDGYDNGVSAEFKQLIASPFPGPPLVGMFIVDVFYSRAAHLYTRALGMCPPNGTDAAVLVVDQ